MHQRPPMHSLSAYLLASALTLVGCGDEGASDDLPFAQTPADASLALVGSRWVDRQGQLISSIHFDPRAGGVSVVIFFRPGDPSSRRALTALAKLQLAHPLLDAYGATPDLDDKRIAEDRGATGAAFPILLGLSRDTREKWGVQELPAIRATNADGRVVARSMMGVMARLEEPAAK